MLRKVLTFLLCLVHLPALAGSSAYQYYQPIEDESAREYVKMAMAELQSRYGQAKYPVRQIHLRRSIRRDSPELISRLDISDWQLFTAQLKKVMNGQKFPVINQTISKNIKRALKAHETLSHQQQLKLIDELNSLVRSKTFYKNDAVKDIPLTARELKWRGAGFWGCFTKDPQRLNRHLLTKIFTGSLTPFKKRSRLKEGRQSCEVQDIDKGIFVLFLKHEVGSDEFYAELGHEVFHLLDPYCFDWLMEGLASVFSEHMALKHGKKWHSWRERFAKNQFSEPYAACYSLVKHMTRLDRDIFNRVVTFSRFNPTANKSSLDLNRWYKELDDSLKAQVKKLLKVYGPILSKSDKTNSFHIKY